MTPPSQYSHPCVISCLWVWTGPSDLLLWVEYDRWWDVTPWLGYKWLCLPPWQYPFYFLLGLHALVKWTAMLERPTWQGIGGDLWPIASKQLRPSIQQPMRKWIHPQPHESWKQSHPSWALRWGCSPSWHLASETLKQRTQLSHAHISDAQKLWDHKCCSFKSYVLG